MVSTVLANAARAERIESRNVTVLPSLFARLWQVQTVRNLLPFVAVTATVVCINEASSALVREYVAGTRGFWVLKPILFIADLENDQGTPILYGPVGRAIYGLLTAAFLGSALYGLKRHGHAPLCWHRLGLGLLIGGMLANGSELVLLGSVTDFVVVRPLGIVGLKTFSRIFNFADLAILSGIFVSGCAFSTSSRLAGVGDIIRTAGRRLRRLAE